MIAFSSGGRCAATWRLLNPPQEMPIIPMRPVHQGCSAIQREDVEAVELLLGVVLVEEHALGVAAAADVDANCRVAVAGEPGMPDGVVDRGRVVLAVGQVLEDSGDGVRGGVTGEPDPSGEAAAVGERDPDVVDDVDLVREGRPDAGAHPSTSSRHGARDARARHRGRAPGGGTRRPTARRCPRARAAPRRAPHGRRRGGRPGVIPGSTATSTTLERAGDSSPPASRPASSACTSRSPRPSSAPRSKAATIASHTAGSAGRSRSPRTRRPAAPPWS